MIVNRTKYFGFLILFFAPLLGTTQNYDTQIANEYFNKHDYEKSYDYYRKLIKNENEASLSGVMRNE